MALNAYLVFAGGSAPATQGESASATHPNSVELLSYSWGAQNAVNLSHTKANPTPLAFTLTKTVDSASVPLFQALLNSSTYGTATLYISRITGTTTVDYLIYTLTSVGVSSIREFFSAGDNQPTEEVVLVFTSAKVSYAKTNANGMLGTPTIYTWNFATNAAA